MARPVSGGSFAQGHVRRMRLPVPVLALLFVMAVSASPSRVHGQETDSTEVEQAIAVVQRPDTFPSIAERARAMLDTLGVAADSVETLRATRLTDPGMELDFLRFQALQQIGRMQEQLKSLAHLLQEASPDSLPTDSVRAVLRGYLLAHLDVLDASLAETADEFDEIRVRRATATAQEIGPLELEIKDLRAWADTVTRYQEWALSEADSLRVDVSDRWKRYDQFVLEFAENTVGRLQIAVSERNDLRDRIRVAERTNAPATEIADLKLRLGAAQTRIDAIADNAASLNDRLEERGYETSAYRENLIRATGEVTGDVLNPQVLLRLARGFFADLWRSLRENAGTVFVRVLIVIAFIVFFRVLFSLLWRLAQAVRLVRGSRLVRDLIGRILRPVATLIGLFAGLSFIGVQTTTLLAGLGVAGLVVGFALQDSLSNLFAGVAILASRPYDVDDIVEAAGVVGKVRAMGLWNTTIVTFDARRLLVPNKNIWGSNVENRSAEVNRRVEAVARIGYTSDLQEAMAVLEQMLREDERVLDEPAPTVWVSRLAESWVEVKLWPWVKTEDWWSMHSDLPRLVRLRLAREGIEVPVPRRDVTTRAAGPPAAEGDTGPAHTT
jgi:small-conductance mechanosensitive channel